MHERKALFLDRDGVINHNDKYVHKKEDFRFIDGIFELVKTAYYKNYKIIIITNQGGIGCGYYTKKQFLSLMGWVKTQIYFDGICYCPHHPGDKCSCRKPNPGMLIGARDLWNIDMGASIMIGDMETDMLAAKSAGVGKKILFGASISTVADFVISEIRQAQEYL